MHNTLKFVDLSMCRPGEYTTATRLPRVKFKLILVRTIIIVGRCSWKVVQICRKRKQKLSERIKSSAWSLHRDANSRNVMRLYGRHVFENATYNTIFLEKKN